jgi:hypothetical protein
MRTITGVILAALLLTNGSAAKDDQPPDVADVIKAERDGREKAFMAYVETKKAGGDRQAALNAMRKVENVTRTDLTKRYPMGLKVRVTARVAVAREAEKDKASGVITYRLTLTYSDKALYSSADDTVECLCTDEAFVKGLKRGWVVTLEGMFFSPTTAAATLDETGGRNELGIFVFIRGAKPAP